MPESLGTAASVISAGSSLAGALGVGSGSGSAKRAAAAAAKTAADMQARAERTARQDLAPYRVGGQKATERLSQLMGLDAFDRDAIASELRKQNPTLFEQQAEVITRKRIPGSLSHQLYGDGTEYLQNGEWVSAQHEFGQNYTPEQNAAIDAEIERRKQDPSYGELTKEFSLADYVADPGYQFRLDEGNKAIERANARRGNFYSGAALKEANRYNSGMASQEYGSAYDRYQTNKNTLYNRLAGLSNTGIGATNTGVQVGQNSASAYGTIYGQLANAKAAANQSAQANRNQGIAGLAGLFGGGGSSYGSVGAGLSNLLSGNSWYSGKNINGDGAITNAFNKYGGGF